MFKVCEILRVGVGPSHAKRRSSEGSSVRPQLSAEVCASARNLPLERFQNFGQSSQLSPFVSFAMLEA